MKFKNKLNGLIFDVVHEDTIKRLKKDKNYELVKQKQVKKDESKTETKKSTTKKQAKK